jgi:2-polyprenyl-3-methyl-5-hydroxy-6-metoxy-1,4-benzoquinol methylase
VLVKKGISGALCTEDFAITDGRYGHTLPIYACKACGFMQCSSVPMLLSYYQDLEDLEYQGGRPERKLQALKLTRRLRPFVPPWVSEPSLLDVGAGSGILVEAAMQMGFKCKGVEPSKWLQGIAERDGLPVVAGTMDQLPLEERFNVITLIDVIEHVEDPLGLLYSCKDHLEKGGVLAVVTPDCGSLAARLLGWRWWHYRVAHVNYFNRGTLKNALLAAGFIPRRFWRPGWYFTLDYLTKRLEAYLPHWLLPSLVMCRRITVPVNLFDSLMVVASKRDR